MEQDIPVSKGMHQVYRDQSVFTRNIKHQIILSYPLRAILEI